jgi:hypothetical protein
VSVPLSGAERVTDPAAEQAATTGVGELLSIVSRDLSTLIRQEVELAKAEVTDSAKKVGKGAGFLGGAALSGYFALLFLSICLWWAIGYEIGNAWSALIIAAVYGVVALVLALRGRTKLQQVEGLPQTAATIKEIPTTLTPGGTR